MSEDCLETDRKKVRYLIGIPTKVFCGQKRIKPGDRWRNVDTVMLMSSSWRFCRNEETGNERSEPWHLTRLFINRPPLVSTSTPLANQTVTRSNAQTTVPIYARSTTELNFQSFLSNTLTCPSHLKTKRFDNTNRKSVFCVTTLKIYATIRDRRLDLREIHTDSIRTRFS